MPYREAQCENCGKTFRTPYQRQRFCCRECADQSWHAQLIEFRKHREPRTCVHCGKPFLPSGVKQKYCSRACGGRDKHENKRSVPDPVPVRIRILQEVPVLPELQPAVGAVYEAERPTVRYGPPFWVIRDINGTGKWLIVRIGECEEV